MKKLKIFVVLGVLVASLQFLNVFAYSGGWEDERVNYIYWSQGGGSNMYWTGVTNKISYDQYKPCVGPAGSEYSCGKAARKSQYKEYGFWVNNDNNKIVHGLETQSGGPLQYIVEMQKD
ncbi:MAG: hypothetical protein MR601_06360 [Erysipelotrichaceae bacterium]|nr:hypothetical protein [Erysipelotrichaceae bacterium]